MSGDMDIQHLATRIDITEPKIMQKMDAMLFYQTTRTKAL
jgi:hypothetical protein